MLNLRFEFPDDDSDLDILCSATYHCSPEYPVRPSNHYMHLKQNGGFISLLDENGHGIIFEEITSYDAVYGECREGWKFTTQDSRGKVTTDASEKRDKSRSERVQRIREPLNISLREGWLDFAQNEEYWIIRTTDNSVCGTSSNTEISVVYDPYRSTNGFSVDNVVRLKITDLASNATLKDIDFPLDYDLSREKQMQKIFKFVAEMSRHSYVIFDEPLEPLRKTVGLNSFSLG